MRLKLKIKKRCLLKKKMNRKMSFQFVYYTTTSVLNCKIKSILKANVLIHLYSFNFFF